MSEGVTVSDAVWAELREEAKLWFESLRDRICAAFEVLEDAYAGPDHETLEPCLPSRPTDVDHLRRQRMIQHCFQQRGHGRVRRDRFHEPRQLSIGDAFEPAHMAKAQPGETFGLLLRDTHSDAP
jgi:hypothetical protein